MRISDWSSDVCSSDLKYWRYSRCLWGLRRRTIRRRNDRGFIYAPGLSAARDRLSLDRAFLGPVGGAGLRLPIPRRAGWRAGKASLGVEECGDGKEWIRKCWSRSSPYPYNKNATYVHYNTHR